MSQLLKLDEDKSELLKGWTEGKPIIHNAFYNDKRVVGIFEKTTGAPFEWASARKKPFSDKQFRAAKTIAAWLRKNGINTSVLKGNNTTAPHGSDKAKNYFVLERGSTSNTIHLNFNMTVENAKNIVLALENGSISFVWPGDLGHSFMFHLDEEGLPE